MGNVPPTIIRHPPQPQRPPLHRNHHLSQMAAVKERITEMVWGHPSRAYYHRRCKRKRSTNIDSLPDEMLFQVLIRVPAQDIYYHARFVCRKWCHMIHTHNFIYAHLEHSTYGIIFGTIIQQTCSLALTKQGQIEISKLRKYNWHIASSCNGLVLGCQRNSDLYTLYIMNPVTKHIFALPPLCRTIYRSSLQGIGYAASSMEYKVVSTSFSTLYREACVILTVGIDKSWRVVRTDHLSHSAKKGFLNPPIVVEGFMHWRICSNQVLTLNVETEIVTETHPPIPQVGRDNATYMSGGRYLSLFVTCQNLSWNVWEMKPESGEWTKLPDIAVEAQKLRLNPCDDFFRPLCWLKYLEVLVFLIGRGAECNGVYGGERSARVYNLRTQEIESIVLPTPATCMPRLHKSSLEWLPGC